MFRHARSFCPELPLRRAAREAGRAGTGCARAAILNPFPSPDPPARGSRRRCSSPALRLRPRIDRIVTQCDPPTPTTPPPHLSAASDCLRLLRRSTYTGRRYFARPFHPHRPEFRSSRTKRVTAQPARQLAAVSPRHDSQRQSAGERTKRRLIVARAGPSEKKDGTRTARGGTSDRASSPSVLAHSHALVVHHLQQ